MHQLQKVLLSRLYTKGGLRYAELTSGYDFEHNVVFHLKQLQSNNLITKNDSIYVLTTEGIQEAAKYEDVCLEDKGVKQLFWGFLCSNSRGEYLLKSHPQAAHDFYNLPSGKPAFGEAVNMSLQRVFEENTGLSLAADRFEYISLHLKTIQTAQGEVLFDDAFAIYSVSLQPEEEKSMQSPTNVNWYSTEEISKLPNRWPEVALCLGKNMGSYVVYTHTSDYIL